VLPGSPANVDPGRYGSLNLKTKTLDENGTIRTEAILRHALKAANRPGHLLRLPASECHLKGPWVQDIAAEKPGSLRHGNTDLPREPRKRCCDQPASRRTAGWPV